MEREKGSFKRGSMRERVSEGEKQANSKQESEE
jgi:hypothetical protein